MSQFCPLTKDQPVCLILHLQTMEREYEQRILCHTHLERRVPNICRIPISCLLEIHSSWYSRSRQSHSNHESKSSELSHLELFQIASLFLRNIKQEFLSVSITQNLFQNSARVGLSFMLSCLCLNQSENWTAKSKQVKANFPIHLIR